MSPLDSFGGPLGLGLESIQVIQSTMSLAQIWKAAYLCVNQLRRKATGPARTETTFRAGWER